MKSMRKVLSCALALTIAASMFAVPAGAEATEEQAVVAEAAETPEAPVSDADGDFVIEGTTLVKYNGSDTEVTIPNTVTVIGNGTDIYWSKVTVNGQKGYMPSKFLSR